MVAVCKRCGTDGVAQQGAHNTLLIECKFCGSLGFAEMKSTKSKYRNKRVYSIEHGHFDSQAEFRRYNALLLEERAGIVRDIQRQVRFRLEHDGCFFGIYVADFVYWKNDEQIVEDVKGYKTATYKTKKRLMKTIHGIDIFETKG